MQFANYTDFRNAVIKMIDGDDVGSGSLSTATLDLLISLGDQAVYNGTTGPAGEALPGLRCGDMETALSLTVTGNSATLPTDCLELKRVQQTGQYPMDYVAEEGLLRYIKAGGGSGSARQYTQQGRNLVFFPALSDGDTVQGRYYQQFADVSQGTLNAAFNRYPDVWLYAALAESAPFLGEDARLPLWKSLYKGRLMAALATERNREQYGSRLAVRAR
jgi:hypothetical protein